MQNSVCLYSLIVTSQLELAKGDAVEVEGEEIEGWLQVCCLCSSCVQQLQASCLAQPPRSAVLHACQRVNVVDVSIWILYSLDVNAGDEAQ
jgi:hypothetical protein